jgi:hypothetical protein
MPAANTPFAIFTNSVFLLKRTFNLSDSDCNSKSPVRAVHRLFRIVNQFTCVAKRASEGYIPSTAFENSGVCCIHIWDWTKLLTCQYRQARGQASYIVESPLSRKESLSILPWQRTYFNSLATPYEHTFLNDASQRGY